MVTQELILKLKELGAVNPDREKVVSELLGLGYAKQDIHDAINLSQVSFDALKKVEYDFVEAKSESNLVKNIVETKPKKKIVYFFALTIMISITAIAIFMVVAIPFLGDKIEQKRVQDKLDQFNKDLAK